MIWTTTPWTLPANLAIAAHPDFEYAGVEYFDPETGNQVRTILAADLVERVMALRGIGTFRVLGRCRGAALEHAQYRHVFVDRESPVVLADYVSKEDGTGLVHTAPGHGADDYRTGRKYGLPTLSPVDESGRFDAEAPEWLVGRGVFAANPLVVERLKSVGALYHSFSFTHSYPHGWRSKKPVIFRATAQWFIGVDRNDLRARTLRAIDDDVTWTPAWGRTRIHAMVSGRPDWCISRQRAWGVPIPALYDDTEGYVHLTAESTRFYRDLFREHGTDAWFSRPVGELIPPDLDTAAHPPDRLRKSTDILDVWFESGSSHRAVVREESYGVGPYPAFLYLEGSDQHRGWFQSSILTAVTHGFVVDKDGVKMSKSVGNVINAMKATEQYGADVLRLYVASMDYTDDIRMSEGGIKEASDAYRKIRNTFRYLLGNLGDYADFNPAEFDHAGLQEIDRWALGELNKVIRDVTAHYDAFDFHRVHHRIYQFCSVDLSSLYLDVLKDRLYADAARGVERKAAQYVLARLHSVLARLIAPIVPHTAEELWDLVPNAAEKPASVHLALWPEPDPAFDDPARDTRWANLLEIRGEVMVALETMRKDRVIGSAQEARIVLKTDPSTAASLDPELLATLCIVSEFVVQPESNLSPGQRSILADRAPHSKCERCWNLRATVGRDAMHPTICARCSKVVAALAV
jgi:isoleucyl-tRNA synthetase